MQGMRKGHSPGKDQINLMLDIGKKAEQQAFAGKGLDYVMDVYFA